MNWGGVNTRWAAFFAAAWLTCLSHAQPFQGLEEVAGQARDLNDFLARPELKAAYKKALQKYYGSESFSCESFETILQKIEALNRSVPGFGASVWEAHSPTSIVRYATPAGSAEEAWELVEPPRRLHALWNDPSQRGCVTESCDKAEVTAPERWVMGLPGTRTFLLHRNGKFQGSGLVVSPLRRGNTELSLVSLTGSGPLMTAGDFSPTSGAPTARTTLFDEWLAGFTSQQPRPDLISVQYDPRDPRVARMVRLSPVSGQDPFAGFLDEFRPGSALAAPIAKVVPRRCFAKAAAGPINLFAGFRGGSSASPSLLLNSPAAVKDMLMQVANPDNLGGFLEGTSEQRAAMGRSLSEILKNERDSALREKAALALRLLDQIPIEDGSGSVPGRGLASRNRPAVARNAVSTTSDPYFDAFRKGLVDSNPAVRTISASALAARGDFTGPVNAELGRALSTRDGVSPAGLSPGALAAMAAQGKNQGTGGLGREDFGSLLGQLSKENDSKGRDRLLGQITDAYGKSKNPDQMRDEIQELCRRDPRNCPVTDINNRLRCEQQEEYDRTIREGDRMRRRSTSVSPSVTASAISGASSGASELPSEIGVAPERGTPSRGFRGGGR